MPEEANKAITVQSLKELRRRAGLNLPCHILWALPGVELSHKTKLILKRANLTLFFLLLPLAILSLTQPACGAGSPPVIGGISPSQGSSPPGTAITFSANYTDPDGSTDIRYAAFLLYPTSSANYTLLLYDQTNNLLYLTSDVNSAWLGGYAPGSPNTISNAYLSLDCAKTRVLGAGNTLTINWSLTAKPAFSGRLYSSLLLAIDKSDNNTNWNPKGSYAINYNPQAGTITPSLGSSFPDEYLSFTSTYSDPDGWQNIQYSLLGFYNPNTPNIPPCILGYDRLNHKLYLFDDSLTNWLGGFSPGSSNIIENSWLRLDCSLTTIQGLSDTLNISWRLSFKPAFQGQKRLYLLVADQASGSSDWIEKGGWNIQGDTTPPTGSITINNNANYTNSASVTLNLFAQENTGGSGLAQMQFSNDNSSWSTPEAYTTTKSWNLTTGDGTKTVYVKYKDTAGNWSGTYSDTITLDTTPPNISLDSVSTPANKDVTLSYSIFDNFTPTDKITVTGDKSPYLTEGMHNVTLTAKDLSGNTASASVSFTIDKTAPVIIITSPQNGRVVEDSPVQLQGTVDGAAFSESRTLNSGENILTKTAADPAGNISSVSVTVYLDMGELIGPEGGVVTSQDGKVKVVIPPGALTTPTRVRISKISNDTLKNATPGGKTLLSVVECKPYGLIFTKPVEIIYTLDQAAIPGTLAELGLYDAAQGKIISTGQTTTVPADGYTVKFSLIHFSTYAALGYLTPQSTPIGGGVKIPVPDIFTGAFGHAIPITVPPGRKGMQPGIALSYRSSNPSSWVGLGFSLNPGYIVRSTRLGPPSYNDTQDTFYFIADAGTTELVRLIDNLYQAKIESGFTKFFKETDDSWRVVAKDGSLLRFGQDSDSKETSSRGTFSWYLTKAVDTNGNYIQYSYSKDQGKAYLSRIDYTGNENGVSPANSVEFYLESRDDISSSYISSSRIAVGKRLKEIQVKAGSILAWRYTLEYNYSPDTNRSLLKMITQYGSDGKSLPAQTLSYQGSK